MIADSETPFPDLKRIRKILIVISVVMTLWIPSLSAAGPENFEKGLNLLMEKNYKLKEKGVDLLTGDTSPESLTVIKALSEGRLFYHKKKKVIVFGKPDQGKIEMTAVISGESLGVEKKRKLKKINTNNKIRTKIKQYLIRIDLNNTDPEVRKKAAAQLLENLDESVLLLFNERLKVETDKSIKKLLNLGKAIFDLDSNDPQIQLNALKTVSGNLNPVIHRKLNQLAETETDPEIKTLTEDVLSGIETRRSFFSFLEMLFFGLSQGSILVLAAIGLAITFGVIGVINMAHGELIMIGAYTTYVIQLLMPEAIGASLFVAVPAAFLVSGGIGILIERSIIRFLYGRPLETLLATFGISLVLQQAVRSIFSPLNRSVETPAWMSGSLAINEIFSLTMNRVVILFFCLLVFAGLFMIMKKTVIGLRVRAVSQNREMARAMGIRAARVDALTFGLGSGIAGIAGVALSQLTNVGPNLGQSYIIDSFMVVVFGGAGNLWGTLVGGLCLGTANKFIEPFSGAVLAKIIILIFIILFIQKRPQGLFPAKGRAAAG